MITNERWLRLSLAQQMANIGSEVIRAFNLKDKGETDYFRNSMSRAIDLIILTIEDSRWHLRLKELTRLHEVLADLYVDGHSYDVSSEQIEQYFTQFALYARKKI